MNIYWPKLLYSMALPFLAGAIGSAFTAPAIGTWYQTLDKPSFNPPNWIFGPVWTTLYIMMGISLYLVLKKKSKWLDQDLNMFYLQLVLNALWSIVFFGLKSPFLGLVVIIPLVVLVAMTALRFYKIKEIAGYLLVPYLLWITFATFLNYNIYILN